MIKVYPFLFLFLIQFLNAQLDWRRTKIGVVFGIDYSKVQHAHNPSGPRFSFYTSVFARIPLGILCACENPKFYIQPQLEYIQTGEKGLKNTLYANNYLSIPIFIKTYPIRYNEMSYFFIQAGPRFSILVNQSVVNPPKDRPYLPEQNGKANNFDLSATIAGGISFGNRSNEILLRYDYSFSDSFPSLNEFNTTGDPNAPLRKVQHIVSIAYSKTLF